MNESRAAGPIAGYGMIADCNSAALIDRSGSIDWLCWPRFDSPSIFARLLDPDGGHWFVRPLQEYGSRRRYLPGTLVLETTFSTSTGEVRVTDALVFPERQRGHQLGLSVPHQLVRLVEGVSGTVDMGYELAPRPEYGLRRPVFRFEGDRVVSFGGPDRLAFSSSVEPVIEGASIRGSFTVSRGRSYGFALRWCEAEEPAPVPCRPSLVSGAVEDTAAGWRSWEKDHDVYRGRNRNAVRISSRVLKGLTYRPTGAIVAAPTTSLPEVVGGERNWDYRYTWIRDASLTLEALWVGACSDEVGNFVNWMAGAAGGRVSEDAPLQIMYGIRGERDLTERTLPQLRGWRNSGPVRIGNGAWTQTQLDIYGEFLSALALYADRLGELDEPTQNFVVDLAETAVRDWGRADAGMWEMRAEPRHHLSSKLLCWVAIDRAIKLAPRICATDRVPRWSAERERIRAAILERGWSDAKQSFAQAFDSDELDAAALLMPIVGFLPATDPRMISTIAAIERELTDEGMVLRYHSHDGLEGEEGTFVICSFWLVNCLARAGFVDKAQSLFDSIVAHANDLGLLAEEIDLSTGEQLGNFPQAFSHIGLITAAAELNKALSKGHGATRVHQSDDLASA